MEKTNKTILVICSLVILVSANLYGCSNVKLDMESEQNEIEIYEKQHVSEEDLQDNMQTSLEQEPNIQVYETWRDAYKSIICDIESNLADPTNWRAEFGFPEDVYVGVHDFDDNEIPELIIGDLISVAVITFEDGKVNKVADLYEPEEWGGLNGLHYQDNYLVLENNGAGGSGFVCFTYDQGQYITGFYCDYHPDECTINEKQVSCDAFLQQFNLNALGIDSRIEYSQINYENEITLAGSDESIVIDDLDFSLIEW